MEKLKRNRANTTQRIIDALEEVMAEHGLEGLSVNGVAEKAGVSKVLIYRYFGGLDGLLEYYVRTGPVFPNFTPAVLEQIRPMHESDVAQIWYRQAIHMFRDFRNSKTARAILKATVQENNSTADVISKAQDIELTRIVNQLSFIKGGDIQAISAILLGGLSYLTIMAQNNRTMIGIDLRSEEGWERIEGAIKLIYMGLNRTAIETNAIAIDVPEKAYAHASSQW